MTIRRKRINWFSLLGVFVAVFLFSFLVQKFGDVDEADAANLANFDPGYIISDYQMTDYGSMSEADIQNFLNSKVSCDKGRDYYDYLVRTYPGYSWHFENGHIICLPEERFGNNNGEIGFQYSESAAHIIWQAAQDYRINPKVLIVTLQKEQGLITDKYPNTRQYRTATGYGCPDTAVCNSEYYGFKNQVRKTAWLFRRTMDGNTDGYYVPGRESRILYNSVVSGCGQSSIVVIRNLATSALYRYTPYQPNAAALAAGYGRANDICAAYGNRNFYLYFEDWFGGITATKYEIKLDDIKRVEFDDGEYVITSNNGKMSMAVDGASKKDGANVEMVDLEKNIAQKWNVEKKEDYYVIKNINSQKVLDIANAEYMDKANVWQYAYNGSCAQRWVFGDNGDGTVTVHNQCRPNYVIDLQDGKTNLQIYTKSENINGNQRWRIEKTVKNATNEYSGVYEIVSMNKERIMQVQAGNDGANVVASTRNGTALGQWVVELDKDGYYSIKNKMTGKALDIANAKYENLTNVWQYTYNGSCAQRWVFGKNGDGTVTIYNACHPSFVLDLQDGQTNIQLYSKTNYENNNQKWVMKKVEEVEGEDLSGIYKITSKNEKLVMGVADISMRDGANVLASEKIVGQTWRVEKEGEYYAIKNVQTGKALDIANAKYENLTNVWQYTYNGSCAQRWVFGKNGDGTVTIYNACHPSFVLDLQDGQTNIQLYSKTNYENNNQKWVMKKVEEVEGEDLSGIYKITSKNEKLVMGVADISMRDGANVLASEKIVGQTWRVEKEGEYYAIKNVQTGKALDIANAKYENLTNVWQYTYNGSCAQRWVFGKNGDGTVTIYNACHPSFVLDLQDGQTNIQLYSKTNYENNNQKWVMKKVL